MWNKRLEEWALKVIISTFLVESYIVLKCSLYFQILVLAHKWV